MVLLLVTLERGFRKWSTQTTLKIMTAITIKSRSKTLKSCQIETTDADNLASVAQKISTQNKKINPNRLRLTYLKESKQIPLEKFDFALAAADGMDLYVKDLGPQISWRLVFVIEYFGPILIHALVYLASLNPSLVAKYHSSSQNYNAELSKLAFMLNLLHYLKREFETVKIHKFSNSTMPLFNVFKNSFHYWVLNGLISLGYFGYGFVFPESFLTKVYSHLQIVPLIGAFLFFETMNFKIHYDLRKFGDESAKKGVTKRVPLQHGLFKIFVAPNYTFEVLSWLTFTVIFKFNLFALIFFSVSTTQMYLWAMKKNKKYGIKRAFLIPGLL